MKNSYLVIADVEVIFGMKVDRIHPQYTLGEISYIIFDVKTVGNRMSPYVKIMVQAHNGQIYNVDGMITPKVSDEYSPSLT